MPVYSPPVSNSTDGVILSLVEDMAPDKKRTLARIGSDEPKTVPNSTGLTQRMPSPHSAAECSAFVGGNLAKE
jgi:hypothetical protein